MFKLFKKVPFVLVSALLIFGLLFTFTNCSKDEDESVPTVTTSPAGTVGLTSAQVGGEVVEEGGSAVTERGIVWAESPDPSTGDNKIPWGTGPGSFTLTIEDLDPETTYYYKAYAINSFGTGYGDQAQFKTDEITFELPTVVTGDVTDVTFYSAVASGEVTDDGGGTVSEFGVCWSTDPNPTIDDNKISVGVGVESFTIELSGLPFNEAYSLRAYAINEVGVAYGDDVIFATLDYDSPDPITDIDGNTYEVVPFIVDGVVIAEFTASDMRTLTFADGDDIPEFTSHDEFRDAFPGPAAAVFPHEDVDGIDSREEMMEKYGVIYNFAVVQDARGVCPDGWRIIEDDDAIEMRDYLTGEQATAGSHLKGLNTDPDDHPRWDQPNDDALDSFGFSGYPGGRISSSGFGAFGTAARFWLNSTNDEGRPRMRRLYHDDSRFGQLVTNPELGMYIRCMRRFVPIKSAELKTDVIEEEDTN